MQSNNFLRPFSTNTTNIYSDSDIDTLSVIGTGAPSNVGAIADSKLYNSLSATTTLACTALIDFVASQNPSVNFGQTLAIDNWISAVNNSFVALSTYNTAITNLINGTTVVGNATNSVNATNAVNAIVNNDGSYSGFTRNTNNVIQDNQNLLMTLKPVYINLNGFNISTETITSQNPAVIPVEYQLDRSKIYYLCGTFQAGVGFGMVSLICDTAITFWRTPIFWTDENTNVYFSMNTNSSTGQINIYCVKNGSRNDILNLFGIYELQIPVRSSTN